MRADGRLLVAPILQTLILNRAPIPTTAWVDRVAQWDFEQIIPCHFDAPIRATPAEFRSAFDFLVRGASPLENRDSTLDAGSLDTDGGLLREIERQLVRWRIIFPALNLTVARGGITKLLPGSFGLRPTRGLVRRG